MVITVCVFNSADGLENGALGWAVAAGASEYVASARHLTINGEQEQAGGVLSSAAGDIVLTGANLMFMLGSVGDKVNMKHIVH